MVAAAVTEAAAAAVCEPMALDWAAVVASLQQAA